ncbi:MAG: hypothetical protein EPN23_07675, partial [Verrucomicrobia bacterium]
VDNAAFAMEQYGYDTAGRRNFTKQLGGRGDVYNYDSADQVTRVYYDALNPDTTPSNPQNTVNYVYDKTGNRSRVTVNGTATRYQANGLNQYTRIGGAYPTYDQAGNLTVLGSDQYAYDAQNRMVSATVGTNMVQSFYDARNRCVARRNFVFDPQASVFIQDYSTCLFYDGWNLIEEVRNNGTPVAYVHGLYTDELVAKISTSNTVYYHADVLGNVTHLTDESGNVVEQYKYDVFGHPTILSPVSGVLSSSAYGNRFLFTGREWLAELGLYDYRNRIYSPMLGRFVQTDPMGFLAGDVNIYRYCGNNPVDYYDFDGLNKKVIKDVTITHYCNCEKCTGKSLGDKGYGVTSDGSVAGDGTVATDWSQIPDGSTVSWTDPQGKKHTGTVQDKGGAIHKNKMDVWTKDHKTALQRGRYKADVTVTLPKGK